MTTTARWQGAASLAARAHRHQSRKDGRTPYVAHPMRVTLTVACVFGCTDETVLAAALLHDTIEDTTIDYDDLIESFGKEVADIVAALSKDPRMIEPEREIAYDQQLADGPWQARLIKLADVYDNLLDVGSDSMRRAMIARARRALSLASGDDRLTHASATLCELVESSEGVPSQ